MNQPNHEPDQGGRDEQSADKGAICGYPLIQSKKIPELYMSAEPVQLPPPPPWLKHVYPSEPVNSSDKKRKKRRGWFQMLLQLLLP